MLEMQHCAIFPRVCHNLVACGFPRVGRRKRLHSAYLMVCCMLHFEISIVYLIIFLAWRNNHNRTTHHCLEHLRAIPLEIPGGRSGKFWSPPCYAQRNSEPPLPTPPRTREKTSSYCSPSVSLWKKMVPPLTTPKKSGPPCKQRAPLPEKIIAPQ